MPILDTEVLFALNPKDRLHKPTLALLAELRERGSSLYVPDTVILEFQAVLRSTDRKPKLIRKAMLALRATLQLNGAKEAPTLDSGLIARQCEIEEKYGLTYFDSLIAASTLSLDQRIVSDDEAYDKIPFLTRTGLSRPRK